MLVTEASSELEERINRKRQQQQQQTSSTSSSNLSVAENNNNNKSFLDDLRKLWTKVCRLSANLFQDKHLHKVKHLIPNGTYQIKFI